MHKLHALMWNKLLQCPMARWMAAPCGEWGQDEDPGQAEKV